MASEIAQADTQLHKILIRGLPLRLSKQAKEWFEGLAREFAILATADGEGIPARLLRFVDEVTNEFSQFAGQGEDTMAAAELEGADTVDLELVLPERAGQAALDLWAHIVAANEFCRRGDLLTLDAPPEVNRFLHWYLHELPAQLHGAEPVPWPGES